MSFHATLIDSRRLTGPNLVWDKPGALLEVETDSDAVIDHWRTEVEHLRRILGLPDMGMAVKRRSQGAWLVVGGPVDQLYGLIEASELAWKRAILQVEGRDPGEPDLEAVRQELDDERLDAVTALHSEAAERDVTFLWDDDFVSLGMGTGSQTWPRSETPSSDNVDWSRFHDIPVAVVTGTNGKSTTVRLLCAMAAAWSKTAGNTSTDWVRIGSEILDTGDYSGPGGARAAVRDPRVEVALLETARGGLLRRGCGLEKADVAAVLNVASDHMGQYGITSVEDLIEAKLIVRKLVADGGTLVLNADDGGLRKAAARFPEQRTAWFTLGTDLPSNESEGACIRDGMLTLISPSLAPAPLLAITDIPITLGGAAAYNVANALAASLIAHTLGMPHDAIRTGLRAFESDFETNPGRSNWFDVGGARVLLDYAHNPHGLHAIIDTVNRLVESSEGPARRIMVLSTAGDRTEAEIRELAAIAAQAHIDEILVADCVGYERELGPMGVPRILADELARHGRDGPLFESELKGVEAALDMARPGDVLILLVKGERNASLERIQEAQERLRQA
jgi:UDP-N-acetylmuramyl tripeptide synthase